jgi:hypothetical protein
MRPRPELLLAAVLAACAAHAPAPLPGSATVAPAPTPTVVPVHVTSSGNGRYTTLREMKHQRTMYVVRALSFVADTSSGRSATGSGSFDRPEITFIDRNGARTVADAPKAVLTSADKSILMTGGVRARSQGGNVLACDQLRYDGTTERIHGSGHVVLQTPAGLTLTGNQLDGDARLQNVRVYR